MNGAGGIESTPARDKESHSKQWIVWMQMKAGSGQRNVAASAAQLATTRTFPFCRAHIIDHRARCIISYINLQGRNTTSCQENDWGSRLGGIGKMNLYMCVCVLFISPSSPRFRDRAHSRKIATEKFQHPSWETCNWANSANTSAPCLAI